MLLKKIILQNFRTYKKREVPIDPQLTIIVGPNASGKTNILESIYGLSVGKSFRASHEEEVISWEEEIARVKGFIEDDELELVMTHGTLGGTTIPRKKFMVNGVSRRLIDFAGRLPAVLFWPEDLSLVIGSPSGRREYMNRVLIQSDREYRRNLYQFEKGLRQRNKLLFFIHEGKAERKELAYWNSILIASGQYITAAREAFLTFLNTFPLLPFQFEVSYDKSIISIERLEQYKDEEIGAKTTLVGPHRDDVIFLKDFGGEKRELGSYASRGEQRLGVLWCKLGEVAFLERAIHKKPMLLLDDIFSELDPGHQTFILSLIEQYQTVMTFADPDILPRIPDSLKRSYIELGV